MRTRAEKLWIILQWVDGDKARDVGAALVSGTRAEAQRAARAIEDATAFNTDIQPAELCTAAAFVDATRREAVADALFDTAAHMEDVAGSRDPWTPEASAAWERAIEAARRAGFAKLPRMPRDDEETSGAELRRIARALRASARRK